MKTTIIFLKELLEKGPDYMDNMKVVNLYPIEEEKPKENILDPEIWDIPEGFYAVENTDIMEPKKQYSDFIDIRKNIRLSEEVKGPIFVNLIPIESTTKRPKKALDPEIWNIPEGYYAIKRKFPKKIFIEIYKKENQKPNTELIDYIDWTYAYLYKIDETKGIPKEEILDPKIWNIPEGYFATLEEIDY